MRDRLADSRFDIILLRFRSSTGDASPFRLGSSEQEFELACFEFRFWSGSSEPELEITVLGEGRASGSHSGEWIKASEPEFEMTGLGKGLGGKYSRHSHGVEPASKSGISGFPNIVPDSKLALWL